MEESSTLASLYAVPLVTSAMLLSSTALAEQGPQERQIEEVVVYGEKVESTVTDTSISITAMSEDFLKDMGVQGPNELVNFIPATTRTDWDIKIRGVGRNFRGLGGDPGVGTYYNGIYSSDFGIAATESALYDIQRIEILRGPQGTLYGRNSVGGVINYVTNPANHEGYEGQVRLLLGDFNTRELYGVVSGPVTDRLAFRLMGMKRLGDGRVEGMGPSEDIEDINDQNWAVTLDWQLTDSLTANLRFNNRKADRAGNFGNGGQGILSEGPCIGEHPITELDDCDPEYRVRRDTNYYAAGLRVVDADFQGAFPYTHPTTGEAIFAYYNREGVDPSGWPYSPSPNYHDPWVAKYDPGSNTKPDFKGLHNNFANESFDQQATSLIVDWDVSEKFAIKYLGSYQWYDYSFDRDNDFSASELSSIGDTNLESVWSFSHELRFFWQAGERWTATSGLYYFKEDRDQHYSTRNRLGKGYVNNPAIYGPEELDTWAIDGVNAFGAWFPDCFDWQQAELGAPGDFGAWCGDDGVAHSKTNDIGAIYEHKNSIITKNVAIYTQGDYQFSDQWSLTLGFRYSEDRREALENRGGYDELEFNEEDWGWTRFGFAATAPAGFDTDQFFAPGVTALSALNVAMGTATFTGDPKNPISPVCANEATACDRPLRLGGLPVSWGSKTSGKHKDESWTYRVNVNWQPTPDRLIYFGVTSGYRAGGFNLGGTNNRGDVDVDGNGAPDISSLINYEKETMTAYELGYKGTHLDGRLQLTAGLYYYDYKNYQDNVERWETSSGDYALPPGVAPPPGRGPVNVTTNVPRAHNEGFEAETVWLATDNLTLGGNYSYTISEWDSEFTLFNQNDPRYPIEIMGGDVDQDPCTLPPEIAVLYCRTVSGKQLTGIPKHKGTVWGSYQWARGYGTFTFYSSVAITGQYYYNAFHRPWEKVPTRYRTDMRLSFERPNRRWLASLFVDNLFDETYLRRADMNGINGLNGVNFPQVGVALAPRFVGFEMTVNFGVR